MTLMWHWYSFGIHVTGAFGALDVSYMKGENQ